MSTVTKSSIVQMLYWNYQFVIVFGNDKSEISFYDSLINGNIPWRFFHQISNIIQSDNNEIYVKSWPIKQKSHKLTVKSFLLLFQLTLHLVKIQH